MGSAGALARRIAIPVALCVAAGLIYSGLRRQQAPEPAPRPRGPEGEGAWLGARPAPRVGAEPDYAALPLPPPAQDPTQGLGPKELARRRAMARLQERAFRRIRRQMRDSEELATRVSPPPAEQLGLKPETWSDVEARLAENGPKLPALDLKDPALSLDDIRRWRRETAPHYRWPPLPDEPGAGSPR
ncbi:MAG: hypothetical protein HY554_06510 [Elusimicrobia bacterium]|nr:hypothetical protein [Elusimicrobiota bacterium]